MDKEKYWADKLFEDNEPKYSGPDSLAEVFEINSKPEPPPDWLNKCEEFDNTPSEPGPEWVNDEKPKPAPSSIKNGLDSAWEYEKTINFEELKPRIAHVLAWTQLGETLDLRDELWADFVKAKFEHDPELKFPDEFEVLDGKTELWEKGFQKGLRLILEQDAIWSKVK